MQAEQFLEALPMPCLLIGTDHRLVHANREASALLGGAAAGRNYVAVLRQPGLLDAVEAAFRLGQPATATFITTIAGRETTWRMSCAPIDLGGGQGILATFEDQTEMQQVGQMRQDFVANVSHELRTPLTALISFIETLRGAARDDAEARDRFLETMEREAHRMNRLVADLLSLSRVESVERVRPTDAVDLSETLGSVVRAMRPIAAEHGARLTTRGIDEPAEVMGDFDQISQVVTNLIENALKYGKAGQDIRLSLVRTDNAPGLRGPAYQITVEDEGPGIDPIHIPRLTERFYRVDDHRSREMGGTGLGLAIVKHIVNRHRGRLRIESTPGVGSRVTVSLPVHD